ncbi:translation initiation factor 3 subunit G [Fusarium oxysporum f. sp. lycopersici 4287]|uniref:Translation initiation factor 3 subunit G n=2 Tax=Fusarium oxysporum TaxID=5507 RepID=A0A0J9V949_FUSO4|nr:translation initiation factor 3 subunit G [Fusarium oxysporum f. sp. lycopersici 4287]EXK32400.1 translation initiation factor 3 subunit G [Fusarium oxysporum f. sp. melonis 26406]KAJ9424106.1 translation initiation factor 3 subunit G [Fusarium oxysporum]KNB07486.1 translation initiation factor 3 subunit G [Fusarium oxysporum f. sp. lycopersici 4287]
MAAAVANQPKHDWADDDDIEETSTDLPEPQTISNKDGTKTIITFRYDDDGRKVKTTRRIRFTTHTETVNPRVADRKTWPKFGLSAKDPPGPAPDTTSVGENIIFRPSVNWRKAEKDESADANAQSMKDKLKDKQVKCRICNGQHFTARCPYKDTMAPIGETGAADVAAGMGDEPSAAGAGAAGAKKGSYVPPALRGDRGAGERMGSKFGERDDFATLRVTNVSAVMPPLYIFILTTSRSPRWQRSKSCATCSSASAASPEYSLPRTGKPVWPRALRSSASRIGAMPSRLVRRWTDLVSSISFCGWSLPRRLSKADDVLILSWVSCHAR